MRNIVAGIDVGTHTIRVVIAEYGRKNTLPTIIGTGLSQSNGLRHGNISNIDDAISSIRRAVNVAERNSGVKIKKAYLSIGGVSTASEIMQGTAIISKVNEEVGESDIAVALEDSREKLQLNNKKVIYNNTLSYKLDGKDVLGHPLGMRGLKLETKTLFVTTLEQHFENLITAVEEAGVEVLGVIPSPVASSIVTLSEKQKTVGCVLIDIGAETVSVTIFENNNLISLKTFSIGSTDITNDIALGLKVPITEAEQIKIGSLLGDYSKKKLDEIIEARLRDVFELVENNLKKMKRDGLLPAGAVIIGGGSNINGIEELSKIILKLPSKIGVSENYRRSKVRDSSWFTAYGLCLTIGSNLTQNIAGRSGGTAFKGVKDFFSSITRQLLP